VMECTASTGADVVFEVTGSPGGAEMMTRLARTRGRIVIVGIFGAPAPVTLSRVLWAEQHIQGARLYEPQDFETAISLVASRTLPLERLISDVRPLEMVQATFEEIERGANFVKVLFRCHD
jgi:(R,R)-butanediol dehydrogenase/meso-butanediol dehydrogenase/diacetyl reductase